MKKLAAVFRDLPPLEDDARVKFELLPGGRFLIERWDIRIPNMSESDAPNHGVAVFGADPEREGSYLQHYFDSRGVARVYKMTFDGRIWKLLRETADFSPLDFSQRYTGTFSEDGRTITGTWEICHDGKTWEHDLDISYTKV